MWVSMIIKCGCNKILWLCLLLKVAFLALPTCADTPEIRAFWVDAFNNGYKTAAQVDQLIADVRSANMNTIIVEVRKRGDVYYNSSKEPWASDSGGPAFDALAYLCQKAHTGSPRIEVHAWFAIGAIWNKQNTPPTPPNHPYNAHPEFLTLNDAGAAWSGDTYWIDLGHPGCAQYHYELCMEVVNNYDVDGIHLDRIRFDGNHWGYNPSSVARYNARYNRTGQPAYNNPDWLQWRRDQVTAFVRRVYLGAISVKPQIKVSIAGNTRAPGITTAAEWPTSAAYSDTLQDWRGWIEEGILDIVFPMTYMDEATHRTTWDRWTQFTKDNQYNRQAATGQGAYLNHVADTITQLRTLRALTPTGHTVAGMSLYSYATTNDNVPAVSRANFISALTTAPNPYDPSPVALFANPVSPPVMSWKTAPAKGYIRGIVTDSSNGAAIESAVVTITGPTPRTPSCDGNGFFGAVDLSPGAYTVAVSASGYNPASSGVMINAGTVQTCNFALTVAVNPPVVSNVVLSNVTAYSATVNWDTDTPASGQVRYGRTSSYWNRSPLDSSLKTTHSAALVGLTPGRVYHFRCYSDNAYGTGTSTDTTFTTPATFTSDIIIDNIEAEFSGSWNTGTTAPGHWGADYQYKQESTTETATAIWRPNIPLSGAYDVFIYYPEGSNRCTVSPFSIVYNGGTKNVVVNQQVNGGTWLKIGSALDFKAGTTGYVKLSNNTGAAVKLVMADAVRFTYVGPQPSSSIGAIKLLAVGAGINLLPKIVSASFGDHFYIQETDSSAGLRVDWTNSFNPGDVVQVRGAMVTVNCERRITASSVAVVGEGNAPKPILLIGSQLGGSEQLPNLPSVLPGIGLCNIGLLACITGKVSYSQSGDFWLDDHSPTASMGHAGVRVMAPGLTPPTPNVWLKVTGIVKPLGDPVAPVAGLEIRNATDITPL